MKKITTKKTRMPTFWDTPDAPWLPILVIHIKTQVKTRQSYKLKKIAKKLNFCILQQTLHAARLLKLFDKRQKYEMDPTRTVGATLRTQDLGRMDGQTDGRMDRRTDGVKPIYKIYNKYIIKTNFIIYNAESWDPSEFKDAVRPW